MKLSGKEIIEIAHDVLAAKVFEEASPLERRRLEAERLVRESFRQYEERGKMLDRSDFRFIKPVLDRMDLSPEEDRYVRRSRNRLRTRRGILIGGAAMVLVLLTFLWDTSRREAVQRRMAEANRLVYLANFYADNNQLDSALLFAGAAYDLTAPHPLPAAQRILAGAFHKGFEGIPLRKHFDKISERIDDFILIPGANKAILVYESGILAEYDLDRSAQHILYEGEYLSNLSYSQETDALLFSDSDTLVYLGRSEQGAPVRQTIDGILLQLAYWPSAGGIIAVTEESIHFYPIEEERSAWEKSLPDPSTFLVRAAFNPGVPYLLAQAANDSIYQWDMAGNLTGARSGDPAILDLALTREGNLFSLSDSTAEIREKNGTLLAQYPLPPPPPNFFEPLLLNRTPTDSALFVNTGNYLLGFPTDASLMDTVCTLDALYQLLAFSPERQAAIDLMDYHLITTADDRSRRLMTLPPFDYMHYDNLTQTLVMVKGDRLAWWVFSFGPVEERQDVQSFFLPTRGNTDVITVEHGKVYRHRSEGDEGWEEVEFPEPIAQAAWHPSDGSLIGLSQSGKLYRITDDKVDPVYDFGEGKEWMPLVVYDDQALAIREKGSSQVILIRDLDQEFATFTYDGILHDVDLSPSGDALAMAGSGNDVVFWKPNGDTLLHLPQHDNDVLDVCFSPDGTLVATASGDHTARLWNLGGELLHEFSGHEDFVNGLAFSPDGNSLITASSDRSLKRWDIQTGELLFDFLGHEDRIRGVNFSPDGQYLLSWSSDGTARLWNLEGEPLAVYRQPDYLDPIVEASFDLTRARVLTLSENGRFRVWLMPSEVNQWLHANFAGREL